MYIEERADDSAATTDGYEGYQKQVQGILTVGEEGEIVILIEPKMKEWLESIECTAEGDA